MGYFQHFIKLHSIFRYAGRFPAVANIQEAINLVISFHIRSEVIGDWLYCFTNPLIGFQLECMGFWFSFKHQAYVYTGRPKDGPAFDESLDEIRARHGSYDVKEVLCQ